MTTTSTTGQTFTATVRKAFRMNARTPARRGGLDLKAEVRESIRNAVHYPGYYNEARTEIMRTALGAEMSLAKHFDGYRIEGLVRYEIEKMTPWQFVGFIGQMVDAGVENVGDGERFFSQMRNTVAA